MRLDGELVSIPALDWPKHVVSQTRTILLWKSTIFPVHNLATCPAEPWLLFELHCCVVLAVTRTLRATSFCWSSVDVTMPKLNVRRAFESCTSVLLIFWWAEGCLDRVVNTIRANDGKLVGLFVFNSYVLSYWETCRNSCLVIARY